MGCEGDQIMKNNENSSAFLKTTRMLSMFERLAQGELLKKSVEAERFGVNVKSIQRDIEDLRSYLQEAYPNETGTEIFYDHRRKGYCLYRDQQNWLTGPEILAIAKILLESRAFTKEEMNQLLDKLAMQSSLAERRNIKELIQNERFHYMPLAHRQSLFSRLWEISDAIRRQVIIDISYIRIGDHKKIERRLKPQGIIFSEYYFYLVAYIHETDYEFPAIYRMDKIENYRLTNEHFHIPYEKRFQEGELRKRIQFMQSGLLMKLRLRFWGESLEAVLDRLPTAHIIRQDSNSVVIEAEVFGRGIKMWLLSQAQYLEVLKPEDFRKEMRETVEAMAGIYKEFKNENQKTPL